MNIREKVRFCVDEAMNTATAETGWWDVLRCNRDAPTDAVRRSFRSLVMKHHPDKPDGDAELFMAIQDAYQAFKQERGEQ